MASDYDTILQAALRLDAVDRGRLIDELARSLASEAGLDADALLSDETTRKLDDNLAQAKQLEEARIRAALDKAMKRRG